MFDYILGNEPLKTYLKRALEENRLPQTLLFTGDSGIGKALFARALAALILKSEKSPDLHVLKPEGKSGLYAIDTLREMMDKEHSAPFESPGKVFILEDVERMQPASANALLKTLEEPSPDTTFILLSSNIQEMLSTILSRCSVLHFQPLTEQDISTLLQAKGHPTHLAKLSHGSAGRAFELAEHPELENQRKILFKLLCEKPSYPERVLQLQKLEELVMEGKEEDPVRVGKKIEQLFAFVLMWHRDQHARKLGIQDLFFPDEPFCEPTPLVEVEKAIEKGRLAFQRNIKLSICLQTLF
ncbi:MAG: hypothetical protein COT85_02880 [Chlamydiae bacterium CG10_big_fil_rev_8_21_14_0_10_42_34]|nr:MAG: hypothetical protein COT85_02880 [Chlamydiae bacterium CG10_big_fil_rev_8_21_14_0_10_42_34]